ncbi:MAG: ketoacyl-ACP synthase III [Alphaproteobacteria bacterium]|nr:ketoacyl-ACP synthase III [Alphaproteobacteria bacterium]
MIFTSRVIGFGSYLPQKLVTNAALAETIDTNDDWIRQRTGIEQRHIAEDNQMCSDLGYHAAMAALEKAGVSASDVDMIVLATTTPDHPLPATATRIQAKLGAITAFAFDVQAVCSGFVYALAVADNFIRCGQAKKVLVIGAETISKIVDWQDRSTCILFGDGAGALLLTAEENNNSGGILSTHLFSDGHGYDSLYVDNSIETPNNRGFMKMDGREIFKSAVEKIGQAIEKALDYNKLDVSDIDWFVPHQANRRIIEAVSARFQIPMEKTVLTIQGHANTSAASIPLAMVAAANDGRIKPGGGITWGAALIRW